MIDPDMGAWTYAYDAFGELVKQTVANNHTTTMSYDALGRMVQRGELEGNSTWVYDSAGGSGIGKLYRSAGPDGYSSELGYDGYGRPVYDSTVIANTTYVSATGYDAYSRPATLTYPSGKRVRNIYNAHGFTTEVRSDDGGSTTPTVYWKAQDYDAEGHLLGETLGNGLQTTRGYVPQTGLIKTIATSGGLQNALFEFDLIGNLTSRSDTAPGLDESFTYDGLNRLKTVSGTTGNNAASALTMSYDLAGNLANRSDVGNYSYTPLQAGDPARPHALKSAGGQNYSYDGNGNLLQGGGRQMTWTSFNMPALIVGAGGASGAHSAFFYDADHNRMQQRETSASGQNGSASSVTDTFYLLGGLYEEVNSGGSVERRCYISAPTGTVALWTEKMMLVGTTPSSWTSTTQYLHRDHLGSTVALSDEQGQVTWRGGFNAWGQRKAAAGSASTPGSVTRGFTGHEMLDDLGLVHMNGRIYDPALGRFLSADPTIQAPNLAQNYDRYAYVLNNPLSLTDPTGFNFMDDFEGGFGSAKALGDLLGPTGSAIFSQVIGSAAAGAAGELGPTISGFIGGFVQGHIQANLSGASAVDCMIAGLESGALGAATSEIGVYFKGNIPALVASEAVVGGAYSELQGGSFQEGALAGAAGSAIAAGISVQGTSIEARAARVGIGAIVGGTAAELGGGKFANGALTGAFLAIYGEVSQRSDSSEESVVHIDSFVVDLGNGAAGFADVSTFGLAAKARQAFGDDITDTSAGWYRGGEVAGVAVQLGTGVAGFLRGIPRIFGKTIVQGLNQSEVSAVSKIGNLLSKNFKVGPKGDIAGAVSDMVGNPIAKLEGGFYDHVKDLGNILRGLGTTIGVSQHNLTKWLRASGVRQQDVREHDVCERNRLRRL